MSERRIYALITLLLALLLIGLLVLTAIWPMSRAHAQAPLTIDDLQAAVPQGKVLLVQADAPPSYTCTNCRVVAVFAAPGGSGYRATLNVAVASEQWDLIATQGSQRARIGTVHTQRLVLVAK